MVPTSPHPLTPSGLCRQAQQLAEGPMDYSDISPLDDKFFTKADRMSDDHLA